MTRVTLTGQQGDPGVDGADAQQPTFTIGTVTTGAAGSSASVTISGGPVDYIIDVTIPRGATGATGATGSTGAAGATPNVTIGTVTTLSAGSSATATITGTTPNLVLNLGIPQGTSGSGASAATTSALGTVQLARDLSGEIARSATSTGTAPVVSERANVPLHDHSRVLRLLPYVVHTSGLGGSYDLPLADSVIILNDSTTTLNLPIPVAATSSKGADYETLGDSGGPNIATRDGSLSGVPTFSQYPLGTVVAQPTGGVTESGVYRPANVHPAQAGQTMTVTLIQDDTGSRTVTWKQYQEIGFTATGSILSPTAPATTAHKATTYLCQWLGVQIGWVVGVLASGVDPALRPLDSSTSKFVRGFAMRDGYGSTLANTAVTDVMAWKESIREWVYGLGAWINPSTTGSTTTGAISSHVLSASGTLGTYGGSPGGQTLAGYPYRESWLNTAVSSTISVARHELSHVVDVAAYRTGLWSSGRTFTVTAGTTYLNRVSGTKAALGSTTSIRAAELSADPTLQQFFFQSRTEYASTPWAGSQSYFLADLSRSESGVLTEWTCEVIAGYLTYQNDTTTGTAEMTTAAPTSLHASIRSHLDTVFGASGLNII